MNKRSMGNTPLLIWERIDPLQRLGVRASRPHFRKVATKLALLPGCLPMKDELGYLLPGIEPREKQHARRSFECQNKEPS
jgi:hypothetical protein